MTVQNVYYEDLGKVIYKKSQRSTRLTIKVEPKKGVIVTVPARVSYDFAEKFVIKKSDWIKKNLLKVAKFEKEFTIFTEKTTFRTKNHVLNIKSDKRDNLSIRVINGKINVKYPEKINIKDEEVQNFIRKGIENALRKEAKEIIPERVAKYAQKYGFKYNNISFKNAKTRWGSCSSKKNLNFNIHLMRLPDNLIDYVILHELAHTIELNHSKNYWKILDTIYGNAKEVDKQLKKYKAQIY